MSYTLFDFLKLLGSLGFFLFGMKLMSESLQRVAGEKMRSILSAITSNKYMGIFTGFLVTAVIQSSSATTVMLVSFVNAGLLSLTESIGVIMGANIGTTVTAWIVLIFGFKVKASIFTLPLIGIALPLLFSKIRKRSSVGELIVGFAIIFMGIDFLKDSAPDINNNPLLVQSIAGLADFGFGSVLIYLAIGTFLTMIVQSSSAVMALTLVLCNNGWISYEMAAAMVLGQNIGTTITANLAAIVGNVSAKRTALAHTIFNITGVALVLVFYYPFLRAIGSIVTGLGHIPPMDLYNASTLQERQAILLALSVYHSVFNILNTILLIGFVPWIEKSVKWIIKEREDDEEFRLKFINTGLMSTGELSLLQAKKETIVYIERVIRMYSFLKDQYNAKGRNKFEKYQHKIKKYEDISDRMEIEIASYLTRISEETISRGGSEKIAAMLSLVSTIESMADVLNNISNTIERKVNAKVVFNKDCEKNIVDLFGTMDELLNDVLHNLLRKEDEEVQDDCRKRYNKLGELERSLQQEHFKNLRKGRYKASLGVIYSDIYNDLIHFGRYALNVYELTISI